MHTIYDLLRRIVTGGAWTEDERREAAALITELERDAVFGTRASEIRMEETK